jgi:hypothetical protein
MYEQDQPKADALRQHAAHFAAEKAKEVDPWIHRSSGMRCKTCIWFVPKHPTEKQLMHPGMYDVGRCRRHAPTMNGYPVVFVNDWCGDHRLDENKV